MPVDMDAAVRITAFRWVPDFAQGRVRDIRVRWALEEAGVEIHRTDREWDIVLRVKTGRPLDLRSGRQ